MGTTGAGEETSEIREGETTLVVPAVARPEEGEVFYNPVQRLARDVSICVYKCLAPETLCDALAASGARGVRIAKEVGARVTCCDRSEAACSLIRRNADLNGVEVEVVRSDASAALSAGHWDAVDVDPFGSPVGFFDLAARAARRHLAITATDPAALCGVYPRVTRRRYLADVVKTEFYHEVGVRILAGFAVRTAAKYDVALRPIFAHSSDHYYRIYFSKETGGRRADAALESLGTLRWCRKCLARGLGGTGCSCGADAPIGPLYAGELFDWDLARRALAEAQARGFSEAAGLLGAIAGESRMPAFHYDHHALCKAKGVPPRKLSKVLAALAAAGFRAGRTHFSETGFRTDAALSEIMKAV